MHGYTTSLVFDTAVEEMQLELLPAKPDWGFAPPISGKAKGPVPLRPLQYLGAKGRAIDSIVTQAINLNQSQSGVLDAFSGSSVVSQALASAGFHVIANDTLRFCTGLASCFLRVGQQNPSEADFTAMLAFLDAHLAPNNEHWGDLVATETRLLAAADAKALSKFYLQIPLIWRYKANASMALVRFHKLITEQSGQSAFQESGLVAAYYAGTYFGLRQSIEIDRLRHGIECLFRTATLSPWQYNTLLTALTTTLSQAVHSAGKHFAQPINIGNEGRANILLKRLLEDRSIDIERAFKANLINLLAAFRDSLGQKLSPHIALNSPIEDLVAAELPAVGLVYADPPYTAQQYSRFYHIPEVVYRYEYPVLQRVSNNVTTGLYPDDKFKSGFCSKTGALSSFKKLFELSRELNASLLLSYSFSASGKTGNDRMISFDQLRELGTHYYGVGSAIINELDFTYRQLNASSMSVAQRQDKEILLSFTKRDK